MKEPEKIIRDYMTPVEKLIILPPDSSIEEAKKKLLSGKTTSILIPPSSGGASWGIFTSSDLVIALAQRLDNKKARIGEFCSRVTKTAKPNWSLQFTLEKMVENGINHMPIYDENRQLIGMISSKDIITEGITLNPTELKQNIRVFLCHASSDKPKVRELYKQLQNDGINPWLDEEDLLPGFDWQIEIPKAVQNSDIVIVCLSNDSVTKTGYIQKEIKYALDIADEQPEGRIFIIPVKLEECDVPKRLSRWQWVNLFSENGYQRLLRSLNIRAKENRA